MGFGGGMDAVGQQDGEVYAVDAGGGGQVDILDAVKAADFLHGIRELPEGAAAFHFISHGPVGFLGAEGPAEAFDVQGQDHDDLAQGIAPGNGLEGGAHGRDEAGDRFGGGIVLHGSHGAAADPVVDAQGDGDQVVRGEIRGAGTDVSGIPGFVIRGIQVTLVGGGKVGQAPAVGFRHKERPADVLPVRDGNGDAAVRIPHAVPAFGDAVAQGAPADGPLRFRRRMPREHEDQQAGKNQCCRGEKRGAPLDPGFTFASAVTAIAVIFNHSAGTSSCFSTG